MENIQVSVVDFRNKSGTFMDILHTNIKFEVIVKFRGELDWYVQLEMGKPGKNVLTELGCRKMFNLKKDSYTRNFWVRMPQHCMAQYEDMKAKSVIRVTGTLNNEVFFTQVWQTKIFYEHGELDLFPPVFPQFHQLIWKIEEADLNPEETQERQTCTLS